MPSSLAVRAPLEAQGRKILLNLWAGWPSPACGEEAETRAFLIRVPEWTTVWIGACASHDPTLRTLSTRCLTNPGNYN